MNCWRWTFETIPPEERTPDPELSEADFCPGCGWLWHQCSCNEVAIESDKAKLERWLNAVASKP